MLVLAGSFGSERDGIQGIATNDKTCIYGPSATGRDTRSFRGLPYLAWGRKIKEHVHADIDWYTAPFDHHLRIATQ